MSKDTGSELSAAKVPSVTDPDVDGSQSLLASQRWADTVVPEPTGQVFPTSAAGASQKLTSTKGGAGGNGVASEVDSTIASADPSAGPQFGVAYACGHSLMFSGALESDPHAETPSSAVRNNHFVCWPRMGSPEESLLRHRKNDGSLNASTTQVVWNDS
jgi:hypothetical protein